MGVCSLSSCDLFRIAWNNYRATEIQALSIAKSIKEQHHAEQLAILQGSDPVTSTR